jgi:hypothetical protein
VKRETYRRGVLGTAFFGLMLIGFLPKPMAEAAGKESADIQKTTEKQMVEAYRRLPLSFEQNAGQSSNQVEFLARGQDYTLFLTRQAEAVLVLGAAAARHNSEPRTDLVPGAIKPQSESIPASVFRMKLVNAQLTPQAEGLDELPGKANYFIGNDPNKWRTNVPIYARVNFHGVYPGVDLVYYGNRQQLEYDFIVAPHADPGSIAMAVEDVEMSLNAQGDLILAARDREVRLQKPVTYQEVDGERREIPSRYLLKSAHQVTFQVAAYDATKSLVIDPTLSYSTYLGNGEGFGMAVDAAGNAFVTGTPCIANFPTTPGIGVQGNGDASVTKLDPTGSAIVYSTCIGGSNEDRAFGIAVDGAGNAYLTGYTRSTDFPTATGASQTVRRSVFGYNAFVTKLNPTGSALVYSSYLGGSMFDSGQDIALDAAGNAYVAGWTSSFDFPTTLGAFQPIYRASNQTRNAFVTKLNADGTALLYSTFLGGSNWDQASGIALDTQANAYVTGTTCSSDFPITPLAFQMFYLGYPYADGPGGGPCNAFVTKLSLSTLAQPVYYSTYLGGTGGDEAAGIAVDAANNAYVTGETCSLNFPVTPLAFQPVSHLQCDAFVTKLNPAGSGLDYSTYLGGTREDFAAAIAVDAGGNAYVTGSTNSTDFPVTPDAFEATKASSVYSWDSFLTVLNPSGSAPLVYSTYFGGSCSGAYYNTCNSAGRSIALDSFGNVYLAGWTYATNFPTTPGAFQTAYQGSGDGFVAKFSGFPTQ